MDDQPLVIEDGLVLPQELQETVDSVEKFRLSAGLAQRFSAMFSKKMILSFWKNSGLRILCVLDSVKRAREVLGVGFSNYNDCLTARVQSLFRGSESKSVSGATHQHNKKCVSK